MDETRKQEQRLRDRVTIEARALRDLTLTSLEAATIAADQSTDPHIRSELIELKSALKTALAAMDSWLEIDEARRNRRTRA